MCRMVKKTLLACLLSLFLLLPGCRPEGVIPPDDMESLLADFYRADATIETVNELLEPVSVDSMRVYLPIVESYGYTKDIFRNSLDYYLHHPDKLTKIYGKVRTQLENEAARPARAVTEEEEEEADENGRTVKPAVEEGTEPAIEREEDTKDEQSADKPAKPQKKSRKKVNKADLKRLEEELK